MINITITTDQVISLVRFHQELGLSGLCIDNVALLMQELQDHLAAIDPDHGLTPVHEMIINSIRELSENGSEALMQVES